MRSRGFLFLSFYIITRVCFNSYWQLLSPYWSYAYEFIFVGVACLAYRSQIRTQLPSRKSLMLILLAIPGGFLIYRAALAFGIAIPFDLQGTETILLLLILAPVLEELIFRVALWESSLEVFKKNGSALIVTTALFSAGHLISYWHVPESFRVFIIYQTLYVILLGLAAGWTRLKTGTFIAPIGVHFCFNLGFYLGSLI